MTEVARFLDQLDAGSDTEREHLWSTTQVELPDDLLAQLMTADRPCWRWAVIRRDAGPPGTALPDPRDARVRLLSRGGDIADVYAAIFLGDPVPEPDAEPLLKQACDVALRGGCAWLDMWLVSRAVLAHLAWGRAEVAWQLLDALEPEALGHPELERVAIVGPIRGHADLEISPWVQSALEFLWRMLRVPSIPEIKVASRNEPFGDPPFERIDEVGAKPLRNLLEHFLTILKRAETAAWEEHPLVGEVRRRALIGEGPPDAHSLPDWFEEWARGEGQAKRWPTARLAGHLLHQQGCPDSQLVAVLIWPLAQAGDLPILRARMPHPEPAAMLGELEEAAARLAPTIADALVAVALPHHIQHAPNLQRLAEAQDALDGLDVRPGGVVEAVRDMVREIAGSREREHAEARPHMEAMWRNVRGVADRLGDPRQLSSADVERAVASITAPALTLAMLELVPEGELSDLERLIQALVLLRAVEGTTFSESWAPALRREASRLLGRIGVPTLFPLRLRLLGELIANPGMLSSLAEHHYERANTRLELEGEDGEVHAVIADLRSSIGLARHESNLPVLAGTVAMLAGIEATAEASVAPEAGELLSEVLALPLTNSDRAFALQGQARLLRSADPLQSAAVCEQAISLLGIDDALRWALLADRLLALVEGGAHERAADEARALSDEVEDHVHGPTRAAVRYALGRAFEADGSTEAALRAYQGALDESRNSGWHFVAGYRLAIAALAVSTNNAALWHDQRVPLDEGLHRLPGQLRVQYVQLMHEAARRGLATTDDAERALTDLPAHLSPRSRAMIAARRARLAAENGDRKLIEDAVRVSLDQLHDLEVRALVLGLAHDHGAGLPAALLEQLLPVAFGQPATAARLLHHLGRAEQACALLRQGLEGEPSRDLRLACAHGLIAMLDEQDDAGRLEACETTEGILEEVDVPMARIDLAAGYRLVARGNRDLLERAWTHAIRALAQLDIAYERAHAERIVGIILADLVLASTAVADAHLAERARWLLTHRSFNADELAEMRYGVAHNLLRLGPVCLPVQLDVASGLVNLLGDDPRSAALRDRIAWIRDSTSPIAQQVQPPAGPPCGPLDEVSPWLVRAVAGYSEPLDLHEVPGILQHLAVVLQVRADAADGVLARLLGTQALLARTLADQLTACAVEVIAELPPGPNTWSEVSRVLSAVGDPNPIDRRQLVDLVRRARDEAPPSLGPAHDQSEATAESAIRDFDQGVDLMRTVARDPHDSTAAMRIAEARAALARAAEVGERLGLPRLGDFLISLGNAWKMPPNLDLDRTLHIYESVHLLDLDPRQRAKLEKVHADALHDRGSPDDLRLAASLLRNSVRSRTGWLRAESLISAAHVARRNPDLDDDEQLTQGAMFLMDATREAPGQAQSSLAQLLTWLGEWRARRPADGRPAEALAQLRERYPHRQTDIDRPSRLPAPAFVQHVVESMAHPATQAYLTIAMKLIPADVVMNDPRQLAGLDASAIHAKLKQESILHDPVRLREALAGLNTGSPDSRPGVLLARVHLLAALCRLGEVALDDVRAASRTAREAHELVSDPFAAAVLIREHARIWCPTNHVGDPVRDFALCVDLAGRAATLEGGEDEITFDTLGLLARGHRYSPSGDLRANLSEARRLYALLIERARAAGESGLLANATHCLAEVESQLGIGDRSSRLRASAERTREALRLTSSPHKKAQFGSTLAWDMTQIALELPEPEQVDALQAAVRDFDEVDTMLLDAAHSNHHRLNRTVAIAALEGLTKGRQAEAAVWRAALESPPSDPTLVATLQHNLAKALVGNGASRGELLETLELCKRAVRVRTLKADARHHWETTLLAGRTQVALFRDPAPANPLAWETAKDWLCKSMQAARVLGSGEELALSASALASLTRASPTAHQGLEVAEEAWTGMRQATPFLLFHGPTRQDESETALNIALWLAGSLAMEGVQVRIPGLVFAMDGERARMVRNWVERCFAPLRRPLHARLARPAGVGDELWATWQSDLERRDPRALARTLEKLREQAPAFLAEEDDLEPTWRWLRSHPGSVAVIAVLAEPATMVVILDLDASDRKRTRVLGVPSDTPPVRGDALWASLAGAATVGSDAGTTHEVLAKWARDRIVAPVLRFLGKPPDAVLWCPGQELRLLAPNALWGDVPVALTAGPSLPDLGASPPRGRSTLVVLADPDRGHLALGPSAAKVVERLAGASAQRGETRILASIGARYGGQIQIPGHTPVTGPASPGNVLSRALDHDVFVVVAHGVAPTPQAASLELLDEQGARAPLDVAALASHPGAFTGATVILLACESGRMGESFHEPGGIAGALIGAGARAVIAPLWPVRLDVAEAVAEAVLQGLAAGREPFEVLSRVQAASGNGPLLGPPASLSSQQRTSTLQRLAFVTWVG